MPTGAVPSECFDESPFVSRHCRTRRCNTLVVQIRQLLQHKAGPNFIKLYQLVQKLLERTHWQMSRQHGYLVIIAFLFTEIGLKSSRLLNVWRIRCFWIDSISEQARGSYPWYTMLFCVCAIIREPHDGSLMRPLQCNREFSFIDHELSLWLLALSNTSEPRYVSLC